jgi:hypothetical protein
VILHMSASLDNFKRLRELECGPGKIVKSFHLYVIVLQVRAAVSLLCVSCEHTLSGGVATTYSRGLSGSMAAI